MENTFFFEITFHPVNSKGSEIPGKDCETTWTFQAFLPESKVRSSWSIQLMNLSTLSIQNNKKCINKYEIETFDTCNVSCVDHCILYL